MPRGHRLLRINDPQVAAFNHDSGKLPRCISRGVDGNPIRMALDVADRAVPVDDNFAEIPAVAQKFLPYPDEILFRLKREIDAGPHPGMNEEEIAVAVRKLQLTEKFPVGFRQRRRKGASEIAEPAASDGRRGQPIGGQGLDSYIMSQSPIAAGSSIA